MTSISSSDLFLSSAQNPDRNRNEVPEELTNVNSVHENCFLCGCGQVTSLTTPTRRHYLEQVEAFKTYLTGREGVETCRKCGKEIKRVWELLQELKAVKKEISQIVERVKVNFVVGNCFICGCGPLKSLSILGRRSYLRQVEVFKAYLGWREGLESCASCLQGIKDVWELDLEIEALKVGIARIVDGFKVKNGSENKLRQSF